MTWFGLGILTVFTFATVITHFTKNWRQPRLWLTVGALMMFHTVGYVVLLERASPWPTIWFAFVAVVEIPMLDQLLYWLGFELTPKSTRGAH